MLLLVIINSLILLSLSLLHFYWANGGKAGTKAVLPATEDGRQLLYPTVTVTRIVASGLLLSAFITSANIGWLGYALPTYLAGWGTIVVGTVFFLRAMGEFKYLGFFKTVKGTRFAIQDTRIYSPLCLFLAAGEIAIACYYSGWGLMN
ncbi:DUF3995 domain-containing protein [Chitinophaga solisilvae]|uniref:DUF3995 domain-containing protein n=1 Tax=Chitinophaga solisilvae TaxID=1233460 RepID=UPI00136AE68A|nr:DUF3995 domain-containing protein [Chitinophaga solisilvae]